MSEASKAVMILLMLIGGSPGIYSRWNENNNFFSTYFKCNCDISKSGKCRSFLGRRLEYHVDKKLQRQ